MLDATMLLALPQTMLSPMQQQDTIMSTIDMQCFVAGKAHKTYKVGADITAQCGALQARYQTRQGRQVTSEQAVHA